MLAGGVCAYVCNFSDCHSLLTRRFLQQPAGYRPAGSVCVHYGNRGSTECPGLVHGLNLTSIVHPEPTTFLDELWTAALIGSVYSSSTFYG